MQVRTPGQFAVAQGATASDSFGETATTTKPIGKKGINLNLSGKNNKNGNSGQSGGGSDSGEGGLEGPSAEFLAADPEAQGDPDSASVETGLTYNSAKGGGKYKKKRKGRKKFAFGSLDGGTGKATDGGAQEFDYGAAEKEAAKHGYDPENYFSLIDQKLSLFKVIEKRYRFKQGEWALKKSHNLKK